jgi:hypothetical protein
MLAGQCWQVEWVELRCSIGSNFKLDCLLFTLTLAI